MSRLFGEQHRALQDRFDSRRMADRIEQIGVKLEIGPMEQAYIEARDMFFLSSVDHRGRPTVSYKGGDPGFVRVLDPHTLAFPSYDGNGMFYSTGNLSANPQVGLLFIDFEKPHRIRVQGTASVSADDPLRTTWKEAELVVRVTVSELWQNCPRYVHRYDKVKASRYVPREEAATPLCAWKRIDGMQDVLRAHELEAVEQAGNISVDEWVGYIVAGDERA
ncbi:MAG: pyridoxamine 5'-phosphate oxidase family protein [Gammaproteobacteria bacterium]|nr:pyridoxamine 5'-phosphate oxidase family protein [Gammaproteobacteria bacterium]